MPDTPSVATIRYFHQPTPPFRETKRNMSDVYHTDIPEEFQGLVNWAVLDEIMSMDENEPGSKDSFSRNLVAIFINQVIDTFHKIDLILCKLSMVSSRCLLFDYTKYSTHIENLLLVPINEEFNDMAQPPPDIDIQEIAASLNVHAVSSETSASKENAEYLESGLITISEFGHYIKGSASSLGFQTIQFYCERIQNYGKLINFDSFELSNKNDKYFDSINEEYNGFLTDLVKKSGTDDDEMIWVFMVKNSLDNAKLEFNRLRRWAKWFYKSEEF